MSAYTRPETKKQFMSRRVNELADAHRHDHEKVKPLDYIVTPMGDVVMLNDKVDRREFAAQELNPGYHAGDQE